MGHAQLFWPPRNLHDWSIFQYSLAFMYRIFRTQLNQRSFLGPVSLVNVLAILYKYDHRICGLLYCQRGFLNSTSIEDHCSGKKHLQPFEYYFRLGYAVSVQP